MDTAQPRFKHILLGGVVGAIVGPVVGFSVGFLSISGVWLVTGLAERWPAGELAQIVPWAIILAMICAVVSCPIGVLTGGVLLAVQGYERPRWQQALIGAVVGLSVGGSSAALIWNLQVNGAIALITTVILGLAGALTGLVVVQWSRRFARPTAL